MKIKWIGTSVACGLLAVGLQFPLNGEPVKAENANTITRTADIYSGTRYSEGGNTPSEGFGSAGFVQYVFKEANGFDLPLRSSDQWSWGDEVSKENLKPGDVLFFKDLTSGRLTTTAIYKGDGKMIYSSVSKGVTTISFQSSVYWNKRFYGAKRIAEPLKVDLSNPLINKAISYLGVPYQEGGKTPAGFDCSGFTKYIYEQVLGIYLPETPEQQWDVGEAVQLGNLAVGDLVFFKDTHRPGISHVGIYAGDNQIINATRIGGANQVTVSYLSNSYLQEKFAGAKRFTHLKLDMENPVVETAVKLIGTPYNKGGTNPTAGFDTGGFVQYVLKQSSGISLPRYGREQIKVGKDINESDLLPGDLVFFQTTSIVPAIYAGKGQVLLVSGNEGVRVVHYKVNRYWGEKFIKARRIL
ncbi:NlpC/P60 family protein [Peribacillus cavernae]|uniref:NlpC/P60 family protein n=1 Tax=Peribacillus cavernae TaxID=1674310 RepID=A0A3S0TVI8_9BACI|nr:NlpC/P60 family protein [Peribacillus cavernae]MDQ0220192.1 cell wall-associated NlpC family hydrolase [Peribacillus cavernae]RUQ28816.1 NlpC/P60 family protein [Peribacillus cavernae]